MITKHIEVVTYTYGDIGVHVRIDYDNGTISLVEKEYGAQPARYKRKDWVFAERQIEYMQSWQNILSAMKSAIDEATKALKEHGDLLESEMAKILKVSYGKEKKKK